ncbi:hypothetical protein NTJ12_002578 [Flavobacterium psychrophilum]|nr:hypothetical protein [Flavobacterium psychrophilum]
MGKALDIHFNKNGKRTQVLTDIEEIRDNIYIKHIGAQLRWSDSNKFSIEPSRKNYPTEFIAPTWIHYDVRQFELKYLEKKYFVKSLNDANGKSIMEIAKETNPNTCSCIISNSTSNTPAIIARSVKNNFTVDDGKKALEIIYDKYGEEMAIIIERMYRDETAHFTSKQYASCGTGGMESHGEPEYYGWDSSFF